LDSNFYQKGEFCQRECRHYEQFRAGNKTHCEGCKAKALHQYLDKEGFHLVKKMPLSLNEYQKQAYRSMKSECDNFKYLGLGLAGDIDEGGDVLWYLSQLFKVLHIDFEDAARRNLDKLEDRMDRGVIRGKGDRR